MDLLKGYEIEECSSQELAEMLSKESFLGSDDCRDEFFNSIIKSRGSIRDKSRYVQGVLQALVVVCQA